MPHYTERFDINMANTIIQHKRASAKAKIDAAALKAGELAFITSGADAGLGFVGVDGQVGTAISLKVNNAAEAAKLSTARNITLAGNVTAPAVAFDGTGDVTINTTIEALSVSKAMLTAALANEIDAKVTSVTATTDKGIEIAGTATAPTVGVKIDAKADNKLQVSADGLYVAPTTAPEYTIVKAQTASADSVATYKLQKDGVDVAGSIINIPLDYLVKSATIKTVPQGGDDSGLPDGHKYIDFEVNVKEGTGTASHLYLDIADMVDPYTSGSTATDPIVVAISNDNKITATLTDGKISLAKLEQGVQDSLGKADTALQPADIKATGVDGTNGTITVKGTEIAVKGLGDAAYKTVGGANGVAGLDANGKLTDAVLPDDTVTSVTAGDKSITVGGTDHAPTVAVTVSNTPNNALSLDANGLYVAKSGVVAGDGLGSTTVGNTTTLSAMISTANAHGLSVSGNGIAMALATGTTVGTVKGSDEIAVAADGSLTVTTIDCGEL